MKKNVEPGITPAEISVSMIDQDLKDGISKPEMAIKYGIKPWEVDEMFKHPDLKGRRPSRKKTLSFKFVDDTSETNEYVGSENEKQDKSYTDEMDSDPNQITLEQAIDEAIDTVEEVKEQMQETQEAIVEMLSPTEYETPEETLLKDVLDTDDDDFTPPSFEDTMELVKEQQEEEIEVDDDTFDL